MDGVLLIPLPYLYTLYIAMFATVIHLTIAVGAVTTEYVTWKYVKSLCAYKYGTSHLLLGRIHIRGSAAHVLSTPLCSCLPSEEWTGRSPCAP
jgi:hypothetical protein